MYICALKAIQHVPWNMATEDLLQIGGCYSNKKAADDFKAHWEKIGNRYWRPVVIDIEVRDEFKP